MSVMPPASCLRSNWPGPRLRQLGAHALAHVAHVVAQRVAAHGEAQDVAAQRLEALAQRGIAGHGARAQQRLVLPGPRLAALVVVEAVEALHQQAALAARPQAHVHLVEAAGGRVHGQHVHQPLHQPQEEHLVVHDLRPGRALHLAGRVVQEHEVEVGAVAELDAAELAVGDRRPCPASRSCASSGPHCGTPWRCDDLLPATATAPRATISSAMSVSRSLTFISGRRPVRSATATRNTATRWNCRSRSTCCSGIVALRARHARAQVLLELRARRHVSNSRSSSSSSSSSGNAAIWSVRNCACAHSSTSRRRATRVLVQQREVHGAPADQLDHVQHAAERRPPRRRHRATPRSSEGSSVLQPPPARLVEPPVIGALAQHVRAGRARAGMSPTRARRSSSSAPLVAGLGLEQRLERAIRRVARAGFAGPEDQRAEVPAHPLPVALELRGAAPASPARPSRARAARARPRPAAGRASARRCAPAAGSRRAAGSGRTRRAPPPRSPRSSFCPASSGSTSSRLPRLQRRLAAAADQLEGLHDELDLADAAGAELDVVAQLAPLDLARDQLLHLAQRLEHAEVEVAAEDEGPQHVAVQLGERCRRRSPRAP